MKRFVLLAAPALLVAACLGSDFQDSIDGTWEMETGMHHGDRIPVLPGHPVTMTIDGGRLGGTAACNAYGGSLDLRGDSFSATELSWTEMACIPIEVMHSEQAFLGALQDVDTVEVIDGRLVLTGPGTALEFRSLEPVPTA